MCGDCLEKYREEKERPCQFCKMPADVCVCSTRGLYYCRQLGKTERSLVFYTRENEVFNNALKKLKYSSDRGAEKFFARELSREILLIFAERGELAADWCVTFPPRRKAALRLYGVDQSKGLAKRVAKFTGMTFESVFSRKGKTAQKTLGAAARKVNALGAFSLARGAEVKGKKYILIDDIVTSGATMKACQSILLAHGASAAFVLSVSKTPMRGAGYDPKLRFNKRSGKAWFNT